VLAGCGKERHFAGVSNVAPTDRSRRGGHERMMPSLSDVGKRPAPWKSPEGHVVVGRRWKYAPPPWAMYEALVDEHGHWLTLLTGEVDPNIVVSQRPVGVIFQPWVDPRVLAVEVRIEPLENTGAALTVLAYAEREELPTEERRWVRYRLGTLFGAALRAWVDEPHWA
jgi:hypothetical protein